MFRMHKLLISVLFVSALSFAPGLMAQTSTASIALNWTAVGDDSLTGTAYEYDLRWSTDSTLLVNSFITATRVTLVPPPQTSGSLEHFLVTGLPADTLLFFAVKVADERPNWSGLSNVVRWRSPDLTPPAAVTNLRVE